ncbi:Cell death protease [Phlyctochytrium bullatum]|nr:Cell death protease [Phlyctochytrium bullatum]
MYDIRFRDDTPEGGCGLFSWPPYLNEMKSYLTRADTRKALHVHPSDQRWVECNPQVHTFLATVDEPSYKVQSPFCKLTKSFCRLSSSIFPWYSSRKGLCVSALTYLSGDKDLICNHIGIEWAVGNWTWNGATGMQESPKLKWIINGEAAGTYQSARNLTNVIMYNTSHMAPVDHPLESLDIFNRFVGYTDRVFPYKSELRDTSKKPVVERPAETTQVAENNEESEETTSNGKGSSFITGGIIIGIVLLIVAFLLYKFRFKFPRLNTFFMSMVRKKPDSAATSRQWNELPSSDDEEAFYSEEMSERRTARNAS